MARKGKAGQKGRIAMGCAALAVMFSAALMFGYNPFQDNLGTLTSPQPVVARWDNVPSTPVSWFLNAPTPGKNVSNAGCNDTLANCIQQAVEAGFNSWTGAQITIANTPQKLTDVAVTFGGTSSLTNPDYQDCQNVIGFSDTNTSDFSTGTIAFTQITTVTRPSNVPSGTSFQYTCSGSASKTCSLDDCITDADIEFNPKVNFTTSVTPPSNTFNLQSVATHEEGHFLGLDHSGIGHTVMFPFGDTALAGVQTQLQTDDAVGISFLYPTASFSTATGVISGVVNSSNSGSISAVFGAHVIAVNADTGNAVVDGITAPDGSYKLIGIPPGNYNILVLPMAPSSDAGILVLDNFSGWECGYANSGCTTVPGNPTNFTGRYY
jgi:hypothetical protein